MQDCIFCKIIRGEIPADIVDQNEELLVIHDINPAAPNHLLVIPKEHVQDLTQLIGNSTLAGSLLEKCAEIGQRFGQESGFRVVNNIGPDGGQTVGHLHFHVLAGRRLGWPPG